MMAERMSLEKARHIAHVVTVGRAKFGAQFSAPFPHYEISEALVILLENTADEMEKARAAATEMVTAANRRAGAAEARLKRYLKREGDPSVKLPDADVNNDGLDHAEG